MTEFKYRATDPDGRKVSGTLEASSARTASSMLFERNLQPTTIKERRSVGQFEIIPGRVSKIELMYFSRQLAAFIRAGVPIQESLETLHESTDNQTMRRVITEVTDSLSAGDNLATAISAHPRVFPNFYRSIMRSAELTGGLDRVLDQLAAYLERDVEAGRRIRQALTYPIVIIVLSIVTVIVLSAFVLPKFETLLNSVGTDPPLATRILLASSRFMGNWWWLIAAVLVGGFLLVASALRTTGGRSVGDKVMLHVPVMGDTVRMAVIERFCRILAAMVDAGVPLPDAMVVAAEASANTVYENAINQAREEMLQGQGLARPLANTGRFPPAMTQMVRVGEETGSLGTQLEAAAGFFEQELEFKTKRLATLFEPIVVVGMGSIVGFIAIALVSAMLAVFESVGE